ncbi:MAG: hypothetical protein ACPG06_07155 [Alphaproteobacteria bacterium]
MLRKTLITLSIASAVSLTALAASASPTHGHHGDGADEFGPMAWKAAAMRSFMEMDQNDDGKVTRYEAEMAYNARYRTMSGINGQPGMTLTEFLDGPDHMREGKMRAFRDGVLKALDARFNDLDRSNDGKVSLYEYETASLPPAVRRELSADGMREIADDRDDSFRRLDHDGDGYIERDEYVHLHDHGPDGSHIGSDISPKLKERMDRHRTKQFDAADTNHDGNLSRVEYHKAEWARFDRLDRNDDDAISYAEMKRAL